MNEVYHDSTAICRSNPSELFLYKGVLKACNKFTGQHPSQVAVSKKLPSNFIEITLWLGCYPAN